MDSSVQNELELAGDGLTCFRGCRFHIWL